MGSTSKPKLTKRQPSLSSPPNPASDTIDSGKKIGGQGEGARTVIAGDASASCSETDARRFASDEGSDYDSESPDIVVEDEFTAGAKEDEILKKADALTLEEVVRRRARRVRQLMKLYKAQYWGLLEEMRSKYRRFYLRHGKSGWRDDIEGGEKLRGDDGEPVGREREGAAPATAEGGMKEPHAPEKAGTESLRCGAQGCSAKPLPLSVFCFAHILLEPRQRLYRPCSYVIRSGQNGTVTCSKPVLRAVVPSLCAVHFQQAQKQAARSLRKAGLVLPPGSASKPTAQLHYYIAEYIRIIQSKRHALRFAALRAAASGPSSTVGGGQAKATNGSAVIVPKPPPKLGPNTHLKNSGLKREGVGHPSKPPGSIGAAATASTEMVSRP